MEYSLGINNLTPCAPTGYWLLLRVVRVARVPQSHGWTEFLTAYASAKSGTLAGRTPAERDRVGKGQLCEGARLTVER
jgi:hypothetical protein